VPLLRCWIPGRHDGALIALFSDKWRLGRVQREHPGVLLEPLIAGSP
jgi:peptide chain release factor 3